MAEILQISLPSEMAGSPGLPGVAPCASGDVLRVDDAYAAQMARRVALLAERRDAVLWMGDGARPAADELLKTVLGVLPGLGFAVSKDDVRCPDGRVVRLNRDDPLGVLGQLVQEDLCILEKTGQVHVLTAAVLCFPASWRLSEKAGRPLIQIHAPVAEYDAELARRVQRLFDGVRPGRPLWRFNKLWYHDPELYQPRSAQEPRRIKPTQAAAPYVRSERQCLFRLPETGAVVFSIHTYVVAA